MAALTWLTFYFWRVLVFRVSMPMSSMAVAVGTTDISNGIAQVGNPGVGFTWDPWER
jgi:hypothetical protein